MTTNPRGSAWKIRRSAGKESEARKSLQGLCRFSDAGLPPERVDSSSLPASENLHKSGNGHPASTYQLVGGHEQTGQLGQCLDMILAGLCTVHDNCKLLE